MKLLTIFILTAFMYLNADEIKDIQLPNYMVTKKDGINIRRVVVSKATGLFVFPYPVRCQKSLELLDINKNPISIFDMHKANALIKIIDSGEYYIKVIPQQDCKITINGLSVTDRNKYWAK